MHAKGNPALGRGFLSRPRPCTTAAAAAAAAARIFWRGLFFATPKGQKKGVRGRGARIGPARRGATCTPLRDLPAGTTPAGTSGLAEHLAPTRRPVRPLRAISGAQNGRPDADRGPVRPPGGREVHETGRRVPPTRWRCPMSQGMTRSPTCRVRRACHGSSTLPCVPAQGFKGVRNLCSAHAPGPERAPVNSHLLQCWTTIKRGMNTYGRTETSPKSHFARILIVVYDSGPNRALAYILISSRTPTPYPRYRQ